MFHTATYRILKCRPLKSKEKRAQYYAVVKSSQKVSFDRKAHGETTLIGPL